MCLGLPVTAVEQKDTGPENALNRSEIIRGEAINPRHEEAQDKELLTGEHIKLQTRMQHQPPSTQ